ncbi:hypothetical protein GCM10023093_17620 [Nemorincola caseinilytica]|uniref:Uncharacterized protein n=1 Tax=Nemorincola caseinilytica TaxID=2054315 RepID=A0ABP8NGF5_9BACT
MMKQVFISALLFLSATCVGQNRADSVYIANNSAPLNKAYNMYAAVNHWKTYKDDWGYTVSFPMGITDGGTTASGIHYYDGNEIAVESSCVDKPAMLKEELKKWYNSIVKDINPKAYDVMSKELTDNSFLIVTKYKDGSGINYEKCITGKRCLFKLSFSIDYHNLKRLSEKDADVIIHLFTASTK